LGVVTLDVIWIAPAVVNFRELTVTGLPRTEGADIGGIERDVFSGCVPESMMIGAADVP